MTRRPSRRTLADAVDDLAADLPTEDVGTVREWARAYLRESLADGDDLTDDVETVQVLAPREGATFGLECYAPRDAVPEWVDVEADLPVREGGAIGT